MEYPQESIASNNMLILSFVCPFMVGMSASESLFFWLLYAPLWIVGIQEGSLVLNPRLQEADM
ncbi:MAG: hypothetical protein R6V83_02765 [Candidatus Thorarchaeota archaeon]